MVTSITQNKEKAEIFNDFFIKHVTLKNEEDTPSDILHLDCQPDEIVLSVIEVKKEMLLLISKISLYLTSSIP